MVRQIPGSIGYVELSYARRANLPTASVRNRSGNFIEPRLDTVYSAADVEIPSGREGAHHGYGFPCRVSHQRVQLHHLSIRSCRTINSPASKAESLARFLWWIVHEGQQYNEQLHYGRLPRDAIRVAEAIIGSMTFDGKPVIAPLERDRGSSEPSIVPYAHSSRMTS